MPFLHFWRFLNAYISLSIYRNHLKFWPEPFLGYICRTPQVRGASVLMTFDLPFNMDLYRALVGKTRLGLLFAPCWSYMAESLQVFRPGRRCENRLCFASLRSTLPELFRQMRFSALFSVGFNVNLF